MCPEQARPAIDTAVRKLHRKALAASGGQYINSSRKRFWDGLSLRIGRRRLCTTAKLQADNLHEMVTERQSDHGQMSPHPVPAEPMIKLIAMAAGIADPCQPVMSRKVGVGMRETVLGSSLDNLSCMLRRKPCQRSLACEGWVPQVAGITRFTISTESPPTQRKVRAQRLIERRFESHPLIRRLRAKWSIPKAARLPPAMNLDLHAHGRSVRRSAERHPRFTPSHDHLGSKQYTNNNPKEQKEIPQSQ